MSLKQTYGLLTAILVGLFLFMQVESFSHGAQLDNEPHQECAVCLVVSEDLDLDPVLFSSPEAHILENGIFTEAPIAQPKALVYYTRSRSPPPRGPPTSLI